MGNNKKKPGHFGEKKVKKEKKQKREVLSFEELPLEEYEKKDKKPKFKLDKKRLFIALGILVLLVLSVVVFFNRDAIFSCSDNDNKTDTFSVQVSGSSVTAGNVRTSLDGLMYCSDTNLIYIDQKGEEKFSIQHGFASPILKSAGDKSIAYDLGATNFVIANKDGKVFSEAMDNKINLADITSEGVYAFVTEAKEYNAKLTVLNASNEATYAYSFSEYYIISMALNSTGTGAVVCGVSAQDGVPQSAVYVLDFSKKEPVAKHIISEDFVTDCEFLSDDSVCVIGEEAAYICRDDNFERIERISFSGMPLVAYDFDTDSSVAALCVSRSGDGSHCNIIMLNAKGETQKVNETNYAIKSISLFGDKVAVSDTSHVYVMKDTGEVINTVKAPSAVQVRFLSEEFMFVLGLNGITGVIL